MSSNERRIILVGKTGNGKSSTGNTLLGKDVFRYQRSLNAVTQKCEMADNFNSLISCKVKVVDTPGLFDAGSAVADRSLEIQRSVEMCPKPHAFLLVLSATGRLTDEEAYTTDVLRIIFGETFFDYCIIVFTHGNEFKDDEEFEEFMSNEIIKELKGRCSGRYIRVENRSKKRNTSAQQLIEMINQLSDNGRKTYIYEHMDKHKLTLIEHQKKEDRNAQLDKVLGSVSESIGVKLGKVWTVALTGTLLLAKIVAAAAVGGIYLGAKFVAGALSNKK